MIFGRGDEMASDAFVDKPFKNREHVQAEIRLCARAGGIFQLLSFPFIALGIISDALNITLGLEPTSWFLLTIIALCASIVPQMHIVAAKHLLGIEAESKKEQ
jgi:hypothetical protein